MSAKLGLVNELHKGLRRNFARRHVAIRGLNDLFQVDLVEMRPYAKVNKGHNYLLTMVDAFSKRAWALPLKTKTGKELAAAVDKIFSSLKKTPKLLQADDGTEFFNKDVRAVLEKFDIKLYSSYSHLKATLIERFNRTIKSWMWREFSLRGTYEWLSLIDPLLERYNTRVHRTIGLAPIHVNRENEKEVLTTLMNRTLMNRKYPAKKRNKYKVGDQVRISKYKKLFEKGYTPNWTTELFIVKEVKNTRPITYILKDLRGEDVDGGFYEEELQKTKHKKEYLVEKIIRKVGNRARVKWLGFGSEHNQWVNVKDLL